jgi:hypothetical protein
MTYGLRAQIERYERQITQGRAALRRLKANGETWEAEADEDMTNRLRRSRTRTGMREARYRLNDKKLKPVTLKDENLEYRAFILIYEQWKESGSPFKGVPLRLEDMAAELGCCDRHLQRVIKYLDQQLGIVVRITGKPNRYAVSLPETQLHGEAMVDTFAAHTERLQIASRIEAVQPNLEEAQRPGLERFQDDDYKLPEGCVARLQRPYWLEQPERVPYRLAA